VAYVEIPEQINQATLIVVGTVEDQRLVRTIADGAKRESALQLLAVRVRLEGVLEGSLDKKYEKPLTFYYYQTTGAWDGPAPNIITPGERGIFYLVEDGGVLRATTDAYASHTRLETGRHTVSPVTGKNQARESIGRLILLPGEGPDLAGYVASLGRNESLALALVGKSQVRQMLQDLLRNPSPAVRVRACITLAEFPLNERGCLAEVIRDVQTPSEDRKRAEELLRAAPKL